MDHAEGNCGSKLHGTTKSSAKSASLDKSTGNNGKAIGDKGESTGARGNKRTRGAADRYK